MPKVEVKGKAQLFTNPVLEALSRTSPALTLIAYVPIALGVTFVGLYYFGIKPLELLTFSLLGVLAWTLIEYSLHRFLFHFINDNAVVQRFHYMVHGVHHHYPKDEGRLFMPPVPGYIIATILFGFWYLFLGLKVFAFFPGFMIGYLGYVFTHYAIHKYKKPKNALGYIWDHHNLHHFKYPQKAFGVSTPLWDLVFGTMPPRK